MKKINLIFKSVLDYFLGFLLVIILIPIQVIITLLIFFIDGKPVFFVQTRAGQFGREFKLFKFRTIFNNNGKKFVSTLGKFLRYTRLDELPQLYNLISGDISLVGPRPLYKKYIKLYNKEQIKRLNFKPGITGWAQINGDNNISWKKKFELDIWYINNFNIFLDIKIIFLTFIFLIKKIILYKNKTGSKIIDEEFNGKN